MSKPKSFEEAITNLESIVKALESGELSLKEAIKTFQDGIRFCTYCSQELDKCEQQINRIVSDSEGTITEEPFCTLPRNEFLESKT